ncbi:MAG: RNA polymerase III subunit C82 [Candelina submexicana]|nr:MAG: RNA polymerase III subunit C82 [Candelina submexicana]
MSQNVFSTLLQFDRLHLPALVHHSNLSPSQIKHGLAVLIQQHLVLHYTPPDRGITFYEANWKNAYLLVRSGKIIKLAESRFGESAGGVVSNLLLLGDARVGDLADAYGVTSIKSNGTEQPSKHQTKGKVLANGVGTSLDKSRHQITTLLQLHSVLTSLLQAGLISEVREQHFRSPTDNFNEAEQEVNIEMSAVVGLTAAKKKAEVENAVREKLLRWRDGERKSNVEHDSFKGRKRLSDGSTPGSSRKRLKLDDDDLDGANGHKDTDDVSNIALDESLVLRINHEKCTVAFRSQQLVELAEHSIGQTTSQVYDELLQRLEEQIPRCHDDLVVYADAEEELAEAPTVSTLKVAARLNDNIDLSSSIGEVSNWIAGFQPQSQPVTKMKGGRLKRSAITTSDEDISDEDEDEEGQDETEAVTNGAAVAAETLDEDEALAEDYWSDEDPVKRDKKDDPDNLPSSTQQRLGLIKKHLDLLANSPRKFITSTGNRGLGEWRVDFASLIQFLRQTALEDTINARFGRKAKRAVALLVDKGKLDEKTLGTLAMIKSKEIRATLTAMQEAGQMELQEVPRDTNRQPSRTIYLWYFDPERCRQLVLEETYKAMARALQRARHEKKGIQVVIDKAERTDVVGKEEQYLSLSERNALQVWRDKEERLLAEVARLDDLVCVLRDF